MARVDVLMPQMGESIAEGTLSKWLKKLGDEVKRDEPLFEISTDKVDAEIPAPSAGVLAEIKVQEGQTVPVQTRRRRRQPLPFLPVLLRPPQFPPKGTGALRPPRSACAGSPRPWSARSRLSTKSTSRRSPVPASRVV